MTLTPFRIGAGLTLLLLVCVLGLYCSASSETNTDKADRFAVNANTAHEQSIAIEESVKPLAQEERAIEKERIQATKTYQKSKPSKVDRSKYEKVRNSPTVISVDDLDPRERKLLAGLRKQYPIFK